MSTTTDKAAPTEEASTVDERTAGPEAIAIELAVGIAGISGGGFGRRSPHVARLVQAARAREGAAPPGAPSVAPWNNQ
jgi:hypothetical protein